MISGAEGVSSSPFFPGQQVPGTGNAVQPGNEPLLYEFVSVFLAPLDWHSLFLFDSCEMHDTVNEPLLGDLSLLKNKKHLTEE